MQLLIHGVNSRLHTGEEQQVQETDVNGNVVTLTKERHISIAEAIEIAAQNVPSLTAAVSEMFVVDRPPTGGYAVITPRIAMAFDTEMTFCAHGFTDEKESTLQYKFEHSFVAQNGVLQSYAREFQKDACVKGIRLGAGMYTITVYVRDEVGNIGIGMFEGYEVSEQPTASIDLSEISEEVVGAGEPNAILNLAAAAGAAGDNQLTNDAVKLVADALNYISSDDGAKIANVASSILTAINKNFLENAGDASEEVEALNAQNLLDVESSLTQSAVEALTQSADISQNDANKFAELASNVKAEDSKKIVTALVVKVFQDLPVGKTKMITTEKLNIILEKVSLQSLFYADENVMGKEDVLVEFEISINAWSYLMLRGDDPDFSCEGDDCAAGLEIVGIKSDVDDNFAANLADWQQYVGHSITGVIDGQYVVTFLSAADAHSKVPMLPGNIAPLTLKCCADCECQSKINQPNANPTSIFKDSRISFFPTRQDVEEKFEK